MIRKEFAVFFVLLLNIGFSFANQGGSDGFGYKWTDTNTPAPNSNYDWVDIKDGNTIFFGAMTDGYSAGIAIPFTFHYYGQVVTTIYVGINGWITFGDPGTDYIDNTTLPSASAANNMLAPFWDDLSSSAGEGGGIYYKTIGTAPFRKMIVQWHLINGVQRLDFEAILFESSNLIKFQYNQLDNVGNGQYATVGIQFNSSQGITYSYNTANSVSAYSAILWHANYVQDADASITPTSVTASTTADFAYKINNIDPLRNQFLGKIDRVAIATPFVANPVVTGIKINSGDAFIQKSSTKPTNSGYASWEIIGDSLVVQTSYFEVIDSLVINFSQQMPSTSSSGNDFISSFDAEIDSATNPQLANDAGWSVTVNSSGGPADVDYYDFSPAIDQVITAGGNVVYTVTARDIYGNGILNNDDVIFSALGSSTATFSPSSTMSFANDSTVTVTVSDNVTGSFSVKAVKSGDASVLGQSGTITVNSGTAAALTVLSSTSAITAGGERNLQIAVEDAFGNRLPAGTAVTFNVTTGGGTFSGSTTANTTTNSNGVAEALYTASTTSGGNDVIHVTSGTASTDISLPVQAGNVASYALVPAGDSTITAGSTINFTITAKDAYGNNVANSGSAALRAQGSTATFLPATINFSGAATANFGVSSTVAGNFTIIAENTADTSIKGQSGLITVTGAIAQQITILSSETAITVGNERLLQVSLTDQYDNPVPGASVTFTRTTGSGTFNDSGTNTVVKTTNSSGIAEAIYTASTSTSFGNDIISVVSGSVNNTITLPLQAGSVSYYIFTPAGDSTISAGTTLAFTLTAKDQFDNNVANTGSVTLSAHGSNTAVFSSGTGPYPFGGAATLNFTVSDNSAGAFTVKAVNTVNSLITGTSGLVTVTTATLSYVLIRSGANNSGIEVVDTTITTDNTLTLYAAGYDQFNNYYGPVSVNWTSNGTLEAVSASGTSYSFSPSVSSTSGQIIATPTGGGVTADQTGTITVNSGTLNRLVIQTAPIVSGVEITDSTITADQSLTAYALGYDADGNFLGRISSNWTGSGILSAALSPANPTDSVFFDATTTGNGSIRATAVSNSAINDITGSITVTAGNIVSVVIRSEPNDGGSEVTTAALTTGQTLNLYANGYDSDGNFNANAVVDWHVSGTLRGLGDSTATYYTVLAPTQAGSGTVYTTNGNGWGDDATGTITVSNGILSSLKIRTATNNGGTELGNQTLQAGNALTFYAAGYDIYGNYLGDQNVTWSVDGDPIGFFTSSGSVSSNTFNATTVNSSLLRIESGTVVDYSGTIKVTAGSPNTVVAVSSTTFSGVAGAELSDQLIVRVSDAFGNNVPNVNVTWSTPSDGSFSGSNPLVDLTDNNGISDTKWKLKSTTVTNTDTAYATVSGLTPVTFIATLTSSTANVLSLISGNNQTGTVGTQLANPFVVEVRDSLNNPVAGVPITFVVSSSPDTGAALSVVSASTGSSGQASTVLTLGPKVGTYLVTAYNNTLTPGSVVFTSTATAATANKITIVSGNNQSGTVGAPLSVPLKVRVTDQYSNPIQGAIVNWAPASDGSVDVTPGTTNSSGIDSVFWTVRTTTGQDTLTASAAGVAGNVSFNATTIAGSAANVVAISGNNRTAVAGGNQKLVARVQDQYGNSVKNVHVLFQPIASMTALNDVSNDSGLVSAVYTTPTTQDSSTANAILSSPTDTASFGIYGIKYVANSLSPKNVSSGDTAIFYIQLTNPGIDSVPLNLPQSTFMVSYNTLNTSTSLDSPSVLQPGLNKLKFAAAVIDSGFPSGTYTPHIDLVGSGTYSNLIGGFYTSAGELAIHPLDILSVIVLDPASKVVSRGNTVNTIQLTVKNNSNNTVINLVPDLTFSPGSVSLIETQTSGPTSLIPGAQGTFTFSVDIPASAVTGTVTVDANVSGELSGGEPIYSVGSKITDSFEIMDAAILTWESFSPSPVSEGQTVSLKAVVRNDGDYDVLVDKDSTSISFGGQVFQLLANQNLEGRGASTELSFVTQPLVLTSGSYAGTLYIGGTESANPFKDTLTTTLIGDLTVQTPANINLTGITLSDTQVSQGESGQTIQVQVTNNGQATARISSAADIILNYSSDYNFTLVSGQTFPFGLVGGNSTTFEYAITVSDEASTGNDSFTSTISFSDVNSNQGYNESNPAINDTWNVLAKSNLTVTAINAVASTVSQGQTGLSVVATLANSGSVAASVSGMNISFKRNSGNTAVAQTLFPFTLPGGSSQNVTFLVNVDALAATGLDSIRATATGSNSRSGKSLSTTSGYLDGWNVVGAPSLVINAVTSTSSRVNRGQQNVPVRVTLTNQGQGTILLDNLQLYNEPVGSTSDTRISPIDSLISGASKTYSFESDILFSPADNIILGARYAAHQAITNAAISDTGGVVRDTLQVGNPSTLVIDSVYADFTNLTQGQSGNHNVYVALRNAGTTEINLDSVRLDIFSADVTNPDAGHTLTYSQVTPSAGAMPIMSAGQSINVLFRVVAPPTPPDSGYVALDARAYGFDDLTLGNLSDLSADANRDTILLKTVAMPTVVAITNPATVAEGQTAIPVTMTLRNRGNTDTRIENVALNFYTDGAVSANTDYTREYVQPTLPFILAGRQDTVVSFSVGVLQNASHLGNINLRGYVQGTDVNRNVSVSNTSGNLSSWTLNSTGTVQIVSVQAVPASVSQGQGPVDVYVRVRSTGQNFSIDSLSLVFNNGNEYYTTATVTPAIPYILNGGLEQTFRIPVNIHNDALPGIDTIRASVNVTRIATSSNFNVTNTFAYDTWRVYLPPLVTIDSVSVSPSAASRGQQNLTSSVYIRNAADVNRAPARIDSLRLIMRLAAVEHTDQFTITRNLTPSLPLVLNQGGSSLFTFDVDVNPDALTGTYTADAYSELTDNISDVSYAINGSVRPGSLSIQDSAALVVESVFVIPDTVSQGQSHGRIYIAIQNTGEASAIINGSSLSFNPTANFNTVYLGPATPFTLTGTSRDTLIYSFVAPASLTGTVMVNATVNAKDLNSNKNLRALSATPGQFVLQTPANMNWVRTSPLSTLGEQNEEFHVTITNTGEAGVTLDSTQTKLSLVGGSGSVFEILLSGKSPSRIPADSTVELIFKNTLLTGIIEGEYIIQVALNGTSNGGSFQQQLNAGALAYGSGLVVVSSINIIGSDRVLQGQSGVRVDMIISNGGTPLAIDSTDSYLIFRNSNGLDLGNVQNLRRLDNVQTSEGFDTLRFVFDIPAAFPLGQANIFGRISLDGGSVVKVSTIYEQMFVESSANIEYATASLQPDSVVNSQSVSFSMSFVNNGSANFNITPDSSYIDFPGSVVPRTYLSGTYTLTGNDTTFLVFKPVAIPATEPQGLHDIYWRLKGTLANGFVKTDSGNIANAFNIIPGAQVVFTNISIIPDSVRQGQDNVRINYMLSNSGVSPAAVSNINYRFMNGGVPVGNTWVASTSGLFPDTLGAGESQTYTVNFNVSQSAAMGVVYPAPIVNFRDLRLPSIARMSTTIQSNDSVIVVRPASIRIDSLVFAADGTAPNHPRVNTDQSFNLSVYVRNTGAFDITNAYLQMTDYLNVSQYVALSVPAGGSAVRTFSYSVPTNGEYTYHAAIDSARDKQGFLATKEQALDNAETVIVQNPAVISITKVSITSPPSATDGTVGLNQTFKVTALIGQSGESGFGSGDVRLVLPANYKFDSTSVSVHSFNKDTLNASWFVSATDSTNGPDPDTLRVQFNNLPTDINTSNDVLTGVTNYGISVKAENIGAIDIFSFRKYDPMSGRDTISTGQEFIILAGIDYNSSLTSVTAKLNYPNGYSVKISSTKSVSNDTITWGVVAPTQLAGTPIRSDDFSVTVSGTDINTGNLIEKTSPTYSLVIVPRANISLASSVSDPPGARDGVVSTQQIVILKTQVSNLGIAGYDQTGTIRLSAHGGIVFKQGNATEIAKVGFQGQAYTDTLLMPSTAGSGYVDIKIVDSELPSDENSAAAVAIKTDSVRVPLQIVKRADLSLRIERSGAIGDSLIRGTQQQFNLNAIIQNNGTTNVDTSRWVILDLSQSGMSLVSGETLRKHYTFVNNRDTVSWKVVNPSTPGNGVVRVSDDSQPTDVNDGLNAFRSSSAGKDSVVVVFNEIQGVNITSRFPEGQVSNDTLIVSTSQDSIAIQSDITFDPQLDLNKTVTLIIPERYASIDSNLSRNIAANLLNPRITWYLRAPDKKTLAQPLVVRVKSKSSNNPLLSIEKTDTLYIKTIPGANLSLTVRIVDPPGAIDDTVSVGQTFKLQGLVRNLEGAALTNGSGAAHISLDNQYFDLIDTLGVSSSTSRTFNVSEPFYWWIKTKNVTQSTASTSNANKGVLEVFKQHPEIIRGAQRAMIKGITEINETKKVTSVKQLFNAVEELKNVNSVGSSLTVSFDQLPNDVNTQKPAKAANVSDALEVFVEPKATITVDTLFAPDKVTTGQQFRLIAKANQISDNLINPQAWLYLPDELASENIDSLNVSLDASSKQAVFYVTIPESYSGPANVTFKMLLAGIDQNTNSSVPNAFSSIVEKQITINLRPKLSLMGEILSPLSAKSGNELSFGQELQIRLYPAYASKTSSLEYAPISGSGTISLDSSIISSSGAGFRLAAGESLEKSFNALGAGNTLTWRLIAPLKELTSTINFKFSALPNEANGLTPVSVDPLNSIASFSMRVRQKEIVVAMVDSLVDTQNGFIQGQQNSPIMAIRISNEGYDDNLYVDSLNVGFHIATGDPTDENLFNGQSMANVFSAFRIVNYDQYLTLAKSQAIPQTLAEINVSETSPNPMGIKFNLSTLTIPADTTETLLILADFNTKGNTRTFRAVLNGLNVYDVSDTISLALIDAKGNNFIGSQNTISNPLFLVPNNPEKAFFNYPNPFGRSDRPITRINYYLDRASDVNIRIFTLTGELVRTFQIPNQAPGVSNTIWDGLNDNSKRIVNGVYICAIEIKPSGGSTKRFTIKIAYIK